MSPDGVATPGEPSRDPWLEARVSRLEEDVGEIKAILRQLTPMIVRMDTRMAEMATKADLMAVRTELKEEIAALRTELKGDMANLRTELKGDMAGLDGKMTKLRSELTVEVVQVRAEAKNDWAEIKVALADKPSRTYMGGIMTAMVAAFACGLGGLAILK